MRQRRPGGRGAVRGAWSRRRGAVAGLRRAHAMARLDDDDVGRCRVGSTRLGGANRKEGGAGRPRTVHSGTRGARRRHRCARVSRPPRTTPTARPRDPGDSFRSTTFGSRRRSESRRCRWASSRTTVGTPSSYEDDRRRSRRSRTLPMLPGNRVSHCRSHGTATTCPSASTSRGATATRRLCCGCRLNSKRHDHGQSVGHLYRRRVLRFVLFQKRVWRERYSMYQLWISGM